MALNLDSYIEAALSDKSVKPLSEVYLNSQTYPVWDTQLLSKKHHLKLAKAQAGLSGYYKGMQDLQDEEGFSEKELVNRREELAKKLFAINEEVYPHAVLWVEAACSMSDGEFEAQLDKMLEPKLNEFLKTATLPEEELTIREMFDKRRRSLVFNIFQKLQSEIDTVVSQQQEQIEVAFQAAKKMPLSSLPPTKSKTTSAV